MPYSENLKIAVELKNQLDTYRPLSAEIEQRIMQKFRLDWNYHSSHIEGNQLTYGETKALILFGQTAQAKPLKDHIEMTGHNEAVETIIDIIHKERPLTESFIRELHSLILKEPYEVDAITPDDKPTKRMIQVGQYKSAPNHVKTKTGEIFYFASPEETPAKMYDLLNWYNNQLSNNDIVNPILFSIEFHYRFIRIHPFDDGNGRLARLLMNFILMQFGYPPAIIKVEDKANYYNALEQADADNFDFFFNYITMRVIASLELMLKGAQGENIDEPDDLDKKIKLLEQELSIIDEDEEVKSHFNKDILIKIMNTWGKNVFFEIIPTIQKFNKLFTETHHHIRCYTISESFNNEPINDIFNAIIFNLEDALKRDNFRNHDCTIEISARYGSLKKGGLKTFGCNYGFKIKFETTKYEVYIDEFQENKSVEIKLFEKLLHKTLFDSEIALIKTKLGESIYNHIDFHTKEKGIR